MAYLVLTLDILVVCVLICSQTFIDNFAGSVGGNQLTKIKGHHCQQVEQMDTHMHTHTYINHSVHNYILTQLSLKGTQLQPQSQCYFHLTFSCVKLPYQILYFAHLFVYLFMTTLFMLRC